VIYLVVGLVGGSDNSAVAISTVITELAIVDSDAQIL
jgi:hypothetical protein